MTRKHVVLVAVVGLLTLAADQGTKYWARSALKGQPPKVLLENYLQLEYHENPGSAFGLMRNVPGARYILIGVGLAALVLVFTMVRKVERGQTTAFLAFALVAGGAVGNLLDRVYQGRVTDFVLMHWQKKYVWPAYNFADAALVVGVVLLVLILGRKPQRERMAEARARTKRAKNK